MSVTTSNSILDKNLTVSEYLNHRLVPDRTVDTSVLNALQEHNVDDESDLVVELIDLYLEDVPQKLKSMRVAFNRLDIQSVRHISHNLKGSSASLGAHNIAELFDQLETRVNDASPQDLTMLMESIELEFKRVHMAFTTERSRRRPAVDDNS